MESKSGQTYTTEIYKNKQRTTTIINRLNPKSFRT